MLCEYYVLWYDGVRDGVCGGGSGGTLDRRPAGEEEEEWFSIPL